ncbi:MAG: hypothetical protein JNL04_12305 [Rhodospirillaceae bacterium]|nr:hypothetical protein [Rhodospirillaceae bacterium]
MTTFYNETYYLNQEADVQAAVSAGQFTSGFQHYQMHGGAEMRNPSAYFDAAYYLAANADVQAAISQGIFRNALEHFDMYGLSENRASTSAFAGFDGARYLAENSDVRAAVTADSFESALHHYLTFGASEGRLAYTQSGVALTAENSTGSTLFFNENYYLAQNPDVRAGVEQGFFANGFEHYQLYGGRELRNPSATFDAAYYMSSNPDVAAAVNDGLYRSPLEHFVLAGLGENRAPNSAVAGFDAARYLAENPDVQAGVSAGAHVSALDHYLNFGAAEARAAYTVSGTSVIGSGNGFTVVASSGTVDEGGTITFTLQTTNVAAGTQFSYSLGGISAADVQGGSLVGTATVDANGRAVVSVALEADGAAAVEGAESLTVTIAGHSASTIVIDTWNGAGATGQTLTLQASSDDSVGGDGNDTFISTFSDVGGTFNSTDVLVGGSGTDTLTIGHSNDASYTLNDGMWFGVSGIERLVFTNTGAGAMTVNTGSAFGEAFQGGADVTVVTTGVGAMNFFMAANSRDNTLTTSSNSGAQNIQMDAGADVVNATSGGGNMMIGGGAGNDTISLFASTGAGLNTISGGEGADTIRLYSNFSAFDTIVATDFDGMVSTSNSIGGSVSAGDTITFGNGLDLVFNFDASVDRLDLGTSGSAISGLGMDEASFTGSSTIFLSGNYSGGVFTIAGNGGGSDTLVLDTTSAGDTSIATADTWVLLVGVNSNSLDANNFI